MDIPTRLRELLEQRGITQTRVAELAGLPNETVNRIVRGRTQNPGMYTMLEIARALGVTVGWFVGEKGFEFTAQRRAELRRFVEWGEELLTATQPDDIELQPPNASVVAPARKPSRRGREKPQVDIPEQFADRGANLVFRAEGDSMIGEHIAHGDLLYVREESDPRHARGRIVVCVVSGSPYVKRLELISGRIRLLSANERFAPMVFEENNGDWNLVGIVIGWSHDAR